MTPEQECEAHERDQAMADLQKHWGDAYEIGWAAGMFVAIRRDDGATTRRPTASELHDEIERDYAARPVPRNL